MRPDEIIAEQMRIAASAHAADLTDFLPEAQSALLALEEAGFAVVPRVATEEMRRAGRLAIPAGHGQAWIYAPECWSAMLTASQSPPAKETA